MKKYQGTASEWAMPRRGSAAVWIVWIVLAIIIGGGLFYYYQYVKMPTMQKQIDDLNAQIQTLQQAKQEAATPADETADWKTYTSTKYGYSVKYPKDWFVSEGTTSRLNRAVFDVQKLGLEGDEVGIIEINVDFSGVSKASVTADIKKELLSPAEEQDTIDDTSATKISGKPGPNTFGGGTHRIYLVFQKGNNIFTFRVLDNDDQERVDTFNSMLSTFQFTD